MSYLQDTIKWGGFDSSEEFMTELQQRLFAKKLARFVLLVMPSREYHLEQEKSDSEMIDELHRLALDFVKHDGDIDTAFDSELVQKFISWSHHETKLMVKKAFETIDARTEASTH